MIILIPIGGTGQRFKEHGYKMPKVLIQASGKPILYYLLDNLNLSGVDYIIIPYNREYKDYSFEQSLKSDYPNIVFKLYCIENNTRGAAETISITLDHFQTDVDPDKPIICLDSDNFYKCDVISKWNKDNCVFSFKDIGINPIFSYVECTQDQIVTNIKEKEKISDSTCTGAYGFESVKHLKKYAQKIIREGVTQKSEFYTSGVIKEMINDGYKFKNIEINVKDFISLGTPSQLESFINGF